MTRMLGLSSEGAAKLLQDVGAWKLRTLSDLVKQPFSGKIEDFNLDLVESQPGREIRMITDGWLKCRWRL